MQSKTTCWLLLGLLGLWIVGSMLWFVCSMLNMCDARDRGARQPKADRAIDRTIMGMSAQPTTGDVEPLVAPIEKIVYFGINRNEIISNDLDMKGFAEYLAQNDSATVSVVGHANVHSSTDFTDKLGMERAEMVRDLLLKAGVPEDRITISSRGQRELAGDPKTDAGAAANRRAVVTLVE
jgi:outer membrane protein OmpA-like peptidoglycan-associated protein